MPPKKILVADDSLTIQKVIRLALANEGYEIQAVSEGKEAIEQIALFQPDLCLIDVSLPRKNAFEVKRELQQFEDFRNLSFILMSSAFEQVDEKQVEELKFDGRLVKPFDPAHLRKTLSEVFGKQKKSPVPAAQTPQASAPKAAAPLSDDLWVTPEEVKTSTTFEPAPPFASSGEEDDIRKLTESTLKMSGLDTMGWSVSDPSRKMDPFAVSTPAAQAEPDFPTLDFEPTFSPQSERMTDRTATPAVSHETALDPAWIRAEVERVVRDIFPKVAEQVIRDEIHKLLQNPPS